MPNMLDPAGEAHGDAVRGVRVSPCDRALAAIADHESRRRRVDAGADARRDACEEGRMETEDRDGGMVIVAYAVILLWLLAIGGLCWLVFA